MNLESRDRPITIYAVLPARLRDYHDKQICEMMNALRTLFPENTFDWEETP